MHANLMSRDGHSRNGATRCQPAAPPHAHQDGDNSKPVAGAISCGHCESDNARDRKFCVQCGQPLWESCESCGTLHASSETYCGHCGHHVAAATKDRIEQFQHDLARAAELEQQHQYDDAIMLLRPLATNKQVRLKSLVQQASNQLKTVLAARDQQRARADTATETARQCLTAHAYERAIGILDAVPQALRSQELVQVLESAHAKRREVLSLAGEIREALQAKRWLELAPRLDRLLTLQPNNKQARELSEQLRQRLEEAAKKRLAQSQYAQSLELLRKIPAVARTADSEELISHVTELAWLMSDLRTEPIVDETLLGVAERLLKLDPNNALAGRHFEQLQQRLKAQLKDPRAAAVPWAAQPQASLLGCTIDWLGGAAQFDADEAVRRELLREHPGRFCVAMGLALQGVGLAHVNVNLMPTETKKSFLPQFTLGRRKPLAKTAWGLDVGGSSLKAVKLSYDPKDGRVQVLACDFVEHQKLIGQPDVGFERTPLIQETLKTFMDRNDMAADQVCVSIAGAKLLGRFFEVPRVHQKKLEDLIKHEVGHQIPFPLGELTWDYQILDEPSDADNANSAESYHPHQVMLIAAKHDFVDDHLAPFKGVDMQVDVLQSDCLALHNFAVREFFITAERDGDGDANDRAADALPPVVLMDVGSEATNIVVSSPTSVWFRSFGLGGNDFVRALIKEYNLSFAPAERLKRNPLNAPRINQFYGALEPELMKLVKDVERSLAALKSEYQGQSVQRLWCVGGGMYLHGLLRFFWRGAWLESDLVEAM